MFLRVGNETRALLGRDSGLDEAESAREMAAKQVAALERLKEARVSKVYGSKLSKLCSNLCANLDVVCS